MIVARALRHPLASQIIPDLLAEAARNPQIAETLQEALRRDQRSIGGSLIGRAVRARRTAPGATDPDVAVDLIVGPLYWRLAIARNELKPADLSRLAAATAAALRVMAVSTPVANGSGPAGAQRRPEAARPAPDPEPLR